MNTKWSTDLIVQWFSSRSNHRLSDCVNHMVFFIKHFCLSSHLKTLRELWIDNAWEERIYHLAAGSHRFNNRLNHRLNHIVFFIKHFCLSSHLKSYETCVGIAFLRGENLPPRCWEPQVQPQAQLHGQPLAGLLPQAVLPEPPSAAEGITRCIIILLL